MDPQMLAAMLMQQGGQQPQNQSIGGMQPKTGIAGAGMQGGTDLMKALMMQRLMQNQQQGQANAMLPGTQQMMNSQAPAMASAIQPPPIPGMSQ
jgi:hypothetical protein